MFIRLFLKYLKPHKLRLAVGIVCMFFVAFLGTYNILFIKPVLDVLFDQVNYLEREAEVDEDIIDRREKLEEIRQEVEKENSFGKKLQLKGYEVIYPVRNKIETRIFGSSFYDIGQLKNLPELLSRLKAPSTVQMQWLREHLSDNTLQFLQSWQSGQDIPFAGEKNLVNDLNRILAQQSLDKISLFFDHPGLSEETRERALDRDLNTSKAQINRDILTDIHPQVFKSEKEAALYQYASENHTKTIRLLVALLLSVTFIRGLLEYFYDYNMTFSLIDATVQMKNNLFKHIISQDLSYLNAKPVGFLMSRVNSDVEVLQNTTKMIIKNGFMQIVRLAFLFSLLLILNSHMTGIVIILILPSFMILAYFARKLKKVGKKGKRRSDILSAVMNESFGNLRLIKALSSEDIESERFQESNAKVFYYNMKARVAKFATSPIIEFLGVCGLSVILLWGGWAVWRAEEAMDPGTFLTYLIALAFFYRPIRQLSKMNLNWQLGKVSGERVQHILDLQPEITDPDPDSDIAEISGVKHGLELKNVSFAYEDKVVLNNLSIRFPASTTTAIVGRSGSGKTTLGNLLLRLYDPVEGSISIDGYDLRQFRLKDLRSHFGIVTQETVLFNDTVARNIAYGTEIKDTENGIDMQRVEEAAKAANAHEFILALDGGKGYHTSVGPGGSALSGGQRQRIAIARAFYRDPEILLLDEATSSLDNESEEAVQRAIESLMHHRTVIIIAHRLSTIMHADNIIVLDDGRLVEQGTHTELISKGGKYATLYRLGEFDSSNSR